MRVIIITIILVLVSITPLPAQSAANADFDALYKNGDYKNALPAIKARLAEIYEKRVDSKRVPMEIISFKMAEKEAEESGNINYLFKLRKAAGFFIENNPELSNLHLLAARCCFNTAEYDSSLNHYYEALRYKQLEFGKDDAVYFEISQVYKKAGHFNAYLNTLESACTLNPAKAEYSLELGLSLQPTAEKKRAIYHLERYITAKGDEMKDPSLYLKLGNLNEEIGRYINTTEYYKKYLKLKETDGYIQFALGHLAFKNIGDYRLAEKCFDRAIELLPENELFRRSKAFEIKGDIKMNDLEFEDAVNSYLSTIKYQTLVEKDFSDRQNKITDLNAKIRDVKSSIINGRERAFDKYSEYEALEEEKGKIELENREKKYELSKLNIGKTRWNVAASYEKLQKLEDAIKYYRECISYNYNSSQARKMIVKLQLKIKRGY